MDRAHSSYENCCTESPCALMVERMRTRRLTDDEVAAIRETLRERGDWRDLALIVSGVLTGYRISELLWWSIGDVRYPGGWRKRVTVPACAMKEGETRSVLMSGELCAILGAYFERRDETDADAPVFRSREGGPLSRSAAYRAVQRACRRANVDTKRVGTHSLRKTFGWRVYERHGSRAAQKALGHARLHTTECYLGIDEKQVDGYVQSIAQDPDDLDLPD